MNWGCRRIFLIQGLERDSVGNATNTSSSFYPMLGPASRIDEVGIHGMIDFDG